MSRQGRWCIQILRKGKEKMRPESEKKKKKFQESVLLGQHIKPMEATVVIGKTLPEGPSNELAQL